MSSKSRRSNVKCPNLTFLQGSQSVRSLDRSKPIRRELSSISMIQETITCAHNSLREDEALMNDPRMAHAGTIFIDCGGVEALHMLVRRDRARAHAEDARHVKKRLPRSGARLARFISLHIADQPNKLGAAVRRRIEFGPRSHGEMSSSSGIVEPIVSRSGKSPRRVRASWLVSPLLFRLIMAFGPKFRNVPDNRVSRTSVMVGGRLLGTGRDATQVYTFDDIVKEHPDMQGMCMHLYSTNRELGSPRCYTGRDANQLYAKVVASMPDIPSPFLSGIALKDILDEDDAGTELQYHHRIHRWFSDKHSLHLTSLHPYLHYIQIDENIKTLSHKAIKHTDLAVDANNDPGYEEYGHKLLVTRLLDGDTYRLNLREEELINLSIAVLSALVIFHEHNYMHMDIKPDNILWSLDRHERRVFCLSDYNLMLSEASVLLYLRPDDGGGFQSVSHGTPGYKSPLLMVDDMKGSTYHKFQVVATKTRAFRKDTIPIWRDYFDTSRLITTGAKIDLHSLALTLIQLAIPPGSSKQLVNTLMGGAFGKFIAKLMFFRNQDFMTAQAALAYLKNKAVD